MGGEASTCCRSSAAPPQKGENEEEQPSMNEAPSLHERQRAVLEAEEQKKIDRYNQGPTGGRRRQAVAGESLDAEQVNSYKAPVYPKDAATSSRIREVISKDAKMQVVFGHLGAISLEPVINAFQELSKKYGEDIIRQGDDGDCLYIIDVGKVDVFVARPDPEGHIRFGDKGARVVVLGDGALFGELALLYAAPRAATVTISSPDCTLWSLDREPFKMLLAQQACSQYTMYEGWLAEVHILKALNRYELSRLSEIMVSELFDDGEVIIQQGDPGDKFYILEDGACEAYISGNEGELKVKEYNAKGQYFGEVALLTDYPRKATIRAVKGGAAVLSLSKVDFTEVLGPIQDILKKDVTSYPEYAEFLK